MTAGNAKTQTIRLLDVFVIGPVMVWGGLKLQQRHPLGGGSLALFGVSTVLYNAANYLTIQSERKRLDKAQARR